MFRVVVIQMAPGRQFSVFLLKPGYDASNCLEADHPLQATATPSALPRDTEVYILDQPPRPPWWKSYFHLDDDLNQALKGAIVILPTASRHFALCFGHVAHNLKEDAFECDFGLLTTLNCVDPEKLKNTDTVEPALARRQRIQTSVDSNLTLFDFDVDSDVLRGVTGKVRAQYERLLSQVTGASNLRITTKVPADELVELCRALLELYASEDYKETFPDIQNVAPVRDPISLENLTSTLLTAFHNQSPTLNLAVPALVNYSDGVYVSFRGAGKSQIYDEVNLVSYYAYLDHGGFPVESLTLDTLKLHKLELVNAEGGARYRYSIFKSLLFEVDATDDGASYFLNEGNWYRADRNYVRSLAHFLDPYCHDMSSMPVYSHPTEAEYNIAAGRSRGRVCLDLTDVSPRKQSKVEPCDVLLLQDGRIVLVHVKVSTRSSMLSHLFNQGSNSVELLKSDDEALARLARLVAEQADEDDKAAMLAAINDRKFEVRYVIATKKSAGGKSSNLPMFSRISLRRNLRSLRAMDVPSSYGFVHDSGEPAPPKAKLRKGHSTQKGS